MKSFKPQSIPLVKLNQNTNQLIITNQAIKYLSSLTNPIAVISIAGLYRTGKSYLVNKLLPDYYSSQNQCAFRVGVTTQSMTKGLNILATPITLNCPKTGKNIDYLLIDSEGIGSCDQSIKYDTDLLILIFLISSTVVYNSMGAIDEQSLEQLQVVLKLKGCVQSKEHEYESCSFKYNSQPPKFMWVLRDFALQLIDKNGKQMSSDEYLEQCLQQCSNVSSSQGKKKNSIRKAIKDNLGQKHCYTLVRPTIKQEDLQHLCQFRSSSNPRIRTEFMEQIQKLKQSLFSGDSSDIKCINGQALTGKLFSRILSEYLHVINNNQLPRVNDVWNSVQKIGNEEFFEELMIELKKEMKQIRLPVSKQELKLKINQLENRLYQQLQQNIRDKNQSKLYHKQFLKVVQKLNKELKDRNNQMMKNNLMKELHTFVKQNLNYESIKPYNMSQIMKGFIQQMKIKINGSEQGYEYLISIINDVFFISEQKSAKIQREFNEIKNVYDGIVLDKNSLQLTVINLKREYHESLKTISRLQQGQADIDKNYLVTKNKVGNFESKITKLQNQLREQREHKEKLLKDSEDRSKAKIDELICELKKVKNENEKIIDEKISMQMKLTQFDFENRKQIIYQKGLEQVYEKVNQEKSVLRKEIEAAKNQVMITNEKYKQMKTLFDKEVQRCKNIEQQHKDRESSLMKQFQNLKKCIKDTRASYEQTFQTKQASDHVLKQFSNYGGSTAKKEKFQTPGKESNENVNQTLINNALKKQYETMVEKINENHRFEIEQLIQRSESLQKELQKYQESKQFYFLEAKQYKQKCFKLQNELIQSNSKFNQCLKEIEESKDKQRLSYQESISRLMRNLEKRQSYGRESMTSSGAQRVSMNSTSTYSRKKRDQNKDIQCFTKKY